MQVDFIVVLLLWFVAIRVFPLRSVMRCNSRQNRGTRDGQFEVSSGFAPQGWGANIQEISRATHRQRTSKVHVLAALRQRMVHLETQTLL